MNEKLKWSCMIFKHTDGKKHEVTISLSIDDLTELFLTQGYVSLHDIAEMVMQQTGGDGLCVSPGDVVAIGELTADQQGFWLCLDKSWRNLTGRHVREWSSYTPKQRLDWVY